jgi:hypothetical protein
MHRLEVTAPDSERRRFVLRRFNDWCVEHDPTIARAGMAGAAGVASIGSARTLCASVWFGP